MTGPSISRRRLLVTGGLAMLAPLFLSGRGSAAGGGDFPFKRSTAQWRKMLGPQRYAILREGGTERAFTSPLDKERRQGIYVCAGCAQPLFSASTKFDSGTGWPSFWRPLPKAIVTRTDRAMMMTRTEVLCARCGGHLGHVFKDGPKPTGLRYCMNGLALRFRAS